MTIFTREMKANLKSLILWCFGTSVLVLSGMSKYTNLAGTGQSMNKLIEDLPKTLQVIMGIGNLDLSTASGYYGSLYFYLLLIASIHSIMLGTAIIAKEERDKTAEFLFAKPVSRKKIISCKLLAALANVLILNIFTLLFSLFIVPLFSEGEQISRDIAILMAGMFFVQLLFLSLGTIVAAVYRKPKLTFPLSAGILMLAFVLSVMIDLNEKWEPLKYFTPFQYFEAEHLINGGKLQPEFVLLALILSLLFILAACRFFNKRDLSL